MRAARIGAAPAADNRGAAPIVCNPAVRTSAVRRGLCRLRRLLRCIRVGIVRLRCRLIAPILELSEISLGRIIRSVIVVLVGIVVAGIVVTHGSNNIP